MMNERDELLHVGSHEVIVGQDPGTTRIDSFLPNHFRGLSRNYFQKLIEGGFVSLNGRTIKKPSSEIGEHDSIVVRFPLIAQIEPDEAVKKRVMKAQLDVKILYEHAHFLIVSKPAGLVVHAPSSQSTNVSLADWAVVNYHDVATVGRLERPGIVHRLDKDTSGLLIVARTNYAHAALSVLFKKRQIKKTYLALVEGRPPLTGTIDYKIDRHPTIKTKMGWFYHTGREAITHYTVKDFFADKALLELHPETGRTHQIRVHCASMNHPIVGDAVYGRKSPFIARQALHAWKLSFEFDGVQFEFTADVPNDFSKALEALEYSNLSSMK